ncbi:MAG TPA: hypothetical protein PLW65_00480 [Pseudomonadota bacterium]|nr:hypothetical protein [Pseudomonadota bacterium]
MRQEFRVARSCLFMGLLVLGACGGAPADEDELTSAVSGQAVSWTPLGGNLSPEPGSLVTRLSLAGDPRLEPVLAFSTIDQVTSAEQTRVARFSDGGWVALGPPLTALGPSVANDSQRRAYLCTGSGGPLVRRWNGTSWVAVGGNISQETGYQGTRYQVGSCGGLVLDSTDTPLVAFSADVGAKANAVYAARWNRQEERWEGLGPGSIGGRATEVYVDIDVQDRLYVAAYSPGGSYGGGATTRVWRWSGSSWTQLGGDLPGTASPVIGVYQNTAYLALHDNASGEIRVLKWRQGAWQPLPSPGHGELPALDFTKFGRPVVAYADAGPPAALRVKYFLGGAWHSADPGVSIAADRLVGGLELSLDSRGRPSLAWNEQDLGGSQAGVFVRRASTSLP